MPHDVVIINYDYGQAEWWPNGNPSFPMCNRTWEQFSHAIGKPEMVSSEVLPDGWCVRPAPMVYTEHFESDAAFSCSLYEISEPQLTRERFFYTSELARIYGVQDAAVIPYVSLGQGWIREGTTRHGIEFANMGPNSHRALALDIDSLSKWDPNGPSWRPIWDRGFVNMGSKETCNF